MVRSVQDFIWEGVEQLFELMDFGKMAESQNNKIRPTSKKLRIKEIPVGFRYKFENGNPDKRGRF
jgi:hypothetical protein